MNFKVRCFQQKQWKTAEKTTKKQDKREFDTNTDNFLSKSSYMYLRNLQGNLPANQKIQK